MMIGSNQPLAYILLSFTLFLTGCAQSGLQVRPTERTKVAVHQVANPHDLKIPAEGWHRFGVLPSTKPSGTLEAGDIRYQPLLQLSMPNSRLVDIVRKLAATQSYSAFVPSQLADKRMSFAALGTFPELVAELRKKANVAILVNDQLQAIHVYDPKITTISGGADFELKQVDMLPRLPVVTPGFFSE